MLLHAFGARAGRPGRAGRRSGRAARRGAAVAVSRLHRARIRHDRAVQHLAAAEAGPLAGLVGLPDLRTLRPALAGIADRTTRSDCSNMFAAAMLAATPVTSGVYYIDDHFVPCTGARPVGKGWTTAGPGREGRADSHVTAHDGRAVCS